MNLASLNTKNRADEGFEFEILHPKTNLPLGIFFTVYGTDSEPFLKTARKQQNRRMEGLRRGKSLILSAEEQELENVATLAACTKSWRTGDDSRIELEPGVMADCTLENAKKLYVDPGFNWLRLQVDREIGDRGNFLD